MSDISPNRHQPRVHFDEESLIELASSIAQIGVLQPILVRPIDGETRFELIAGERRWRAAGRAGLATIPAIVRTGDDLGSVEKALVENLHRQDLTPLEEAAAFQQLIEDFGLTHGRSPTASARAARRSATRCACSVSRRRCSTTSPTASCRPGTPAPCWARRTACCRSSSPASSWRRAGPSARWRRPCASAACFRRPNSRRPDGPRPGTGPIDGAGLTPSTRLRPPGLARARGAPRRLSRHARRRPHGRQTGQGDDRIRRSRGPRAHLPPDHQRPRLKVPVRVTHRCAEPCG